MKAGLLRVFENAACPICRASGKEMKMKAILGLWGHRYLRSIGILLIVVALAAGILSCEPGDTYALTMAENPPEGGTAIDVTNASPYTALKIVTIKAVPADCYRFVSWTAPAGIIGNATAAETTFIMPAQDVTVTANFELVPPDHYKFYEVGGEVVPIEEEVKLVDQFGTFYATVGAAIDFGTPVEKTHLPIEPTPIADENRHYTLYELLYEELPQTWTVMVNNQFGDDQELTVQGPVALAVPTTKEGHEQPECLNHFLVYQVVPPPFEPEPVDVDLEDQFTQGPVMVYEPIAFANPVEKTVVDSGDVAEIVDPDLHWVLYDIWDEESPPVDKTIQIVNQFGNQTIDLLEREYLAVPSQKIEWEQPLNHFKTYWAEWAGEPPMYEVPVQLEDQFVTINATVLWPELFANPTYKVKMVGEHDEWTPIWDPKDHLTFYRLAHNVSPQVWEVTVTNQFDPEPEPLEPPIYQTVWITGPKYLAVPTQKGDYGPPDSLDHFLVYEVLDWSWYPEIDTFLWDQFTEQYAGVYEPELFAVPCQKTDGPVPTPIIEGDYHLLFYWIDGGMAYNEEPLPIENQFGKQVLWWWQSEEDLLGVPSLKIDVKGPWPLE